jgi:hypothetical protein
MNATISRAAGIFALCGLLLLACGGARATDIVSVTDQAFVVHDYSNIVISEEQARSARVYLGADQLILGALPAADQDEVRAIALDGLKRKAQLVSRRQDSNLVVQVTFDRTANLAIRNPKKVPARGYIMLGICNFPITATIGSDCDNLTYFYFADYKAGDIFQATFSKWLGEKFPVSAK